MSELYWITVLGNLHIIGGTFLIISSLLLMPSVAFSITAKENEDYKEIVCGLKVVVSTWVVALLLTVFIPSEEKLYVIYGIGTTIDYIKENETAKQLPDKAIKALDIYLETLTNENSSQ